MMEFGKLMGNEEMKRVRDAFYYMDEDANGTPRLFFLIMQEVLTG